MPVDLNRIVTNGFYRAPDGKVFQAKGLSSLIANRQRIVNAIKVDTRQPAMIDLLQFGQTFNPMGQEEVRKYLIGLGITQNNVAGKLITQS